MTIDERLEKLAERHQALTETVEILAGIQKQTEKQFQQTGRNIERLAEVFADEHQKLLTSQIVLTDRMGKLAEAQAASFKETDERMGILIKMMDEWIRRNPAPPQTG